MGRGRCGGPPDRGRPRPQDAAAIPDAQPDGRPDAAGGGPECRGQDDCRSACDWLRWCFENPRVCARPDPRFAGDVEDLCRDNCALLTARVCRLRNCTELNRAAPGLGDDWREQCSE